MQALITLILWWCSFCGADPNSTNAQQVLQDDASLKIYHYQNCSGISYDQWKQQLYNTPTPKDGGGNIGDELGAS